MPSRQALKRQLPVVLAILLLAAVGVGFSELRSGSTCPVDTSSTTVGACPMAGGAAAACGEGGCAKAGAPGCGADQAKCQEECAANKCADCPNKSNCADCPNKGQCGDKSKCGEKCGNKPAAEKPAAPKCH